MRKVKVVVRREEATSMSVSTVRYGECEKNHAANIGGYAVDGCREFMASNGEDGSVAALTCAACGCHRNFHRRLIETNLPCDCSYPSDQSF